MKFYVNDEVEITYARSSYRGTVTGFYEDGKPRLVNSNGEVLSFPDYVMSDRSMIAIVKKSPQRTESESFFNERSFFERLFYLFTGKMP